MENNSKNEINTKQDVKSFDLSSTHEQDGTQSATHTGTNPRNTVLLSNAQYIIVNWRDL